MKFTVSFHPTLSTRAKRPFLTSLQYAIQLNATLNLIWSYVVPRISTRLTRREKDVQVLYQRSPTVARRYPNPCTIVKRSPMKMAEPPTSKMSFLLSQSSIQ